MRDRQPDRRTVLKGTVVGVVVPLVGSAGATTQGDEVTIVGTNAPVDAGDTLEVTAVIENTGDERYTAALTLVVGHDPTTVDERTVTVEPGTWEQVDLAFETYPVQQDDEFPVRVESDGATDELTVRVFGTAGSELEPRRPASSELTIETGSTVLFEAHPPSAVEPGDVEWDADGDHGRGTPLPTDYVYATGFPATFRAFDSPGTYSVTGTYQAAGETSTVEWTVHVEPDGTSRPTIELESEPGEGERIGVDDTVEITAAASAPGGTLDRLVWVEGQNRTVPAVAELEGARDTATLARENPGWIAAGYTTSAVAVTEAGIVSESATVEGPEIRPPFAVDILETNDPVDAGDVLEVTAAVENVGDMMMIGDPTQELELVVGHDPAVVDTETVSAGWSETERIELAFETATVERTQTFPVRVEGGDDADERTVEVLGVDEDEDDEADVDVTIRETNSPVDAGDTLEVVAAVENGSDERTAGDAALVVGHDPQVVDSRTVAIGGNETETATLTFETAVVEHTQEFPTRVEFSDESAEQSVRVRGVVADEPPDEPSADEPVNGDPEGDDDDDGGDTDIDGGGDTDIDDGDDATDEPPDGGTTENGADGSAEYTGDSTADADGSTGNDTDSAETAADEADA